MCISAVSIMADNHTEEERSYNMSQIRSKNTKPEDFVRKQLFAAGLRYRKNDKRYPGKPDIILPKYKVAVFVNGCFWHMHDCPSFVMPKSRLDYWMPKLQRNQERDSRHAESLRALGWRVITIWECELKTREKREERIQLLISQIKAGCKEG